MIPASTIRIDAGDATSLALLNCCVREISGPERQAWPDDGHLIVRLARVGVLVRARLLRPQAGPAPRLAAPVEELRDTWEPVGWRRLADLISGELELTTGIANPEFGGQVAASHAAMTAILGARDENSPNGDTYLDSEQALVAGHRFHPAPKASSGDTEMWLKYAPESLGRFKLHWLAVRDDALAEEGETGVLDRLGPAAPSGYRALPVHPWQLSLHRPRLAAVFASGALIDLGEGGPFVVPTSSVRTVYTDDVFLKFSLDVRITNCVRKNSWYELSGAVALTEALRPVVADLPSGCAVLGEPGYRTAALAGRELYEGLGVIVRDGIGGCAGTPLLAAAIADPYECSPAAVSRLVGDSAALDWWDAYVRCVVPPVLHAFFRHGVVLEPHLQNVLVATDATGMPVHAVFRDLEGTKLLPEHWAPFLAALPERVAAGLTYDREHGWNRIAYCLFVNHLAEIAAAVADLAAPAAAAADLERELWHRVRAAVSCFGSAAGAEPPELRALLAGVPFPAKANLRTRWARDPDRHASYVPVLNPLGARE